MRTGRFRSLSILVGVIVAAVGAAITYWGAHLLFVSVTGADSAGLAAIVIPLGLWVGVVAGFGGLGVLMTGVYLLAYGGRPIAGSEEGPV